MIKNDENHPFFFIFAELYLCEFLELDTFVRLFEKLEVRTLTNY